MLNGTIMLNKIGFKYKYHLAYFAVASVAIFMRFLIPQNPRIDAVHDDSLMVQLAYSILQGNWLGDWNSTIHPALTLLKPPGYPLYLALCMKIGLPPAVGALILYLAASIVLIKYGLPGKLFEKRKLLIFFLFAFNPAFFGDGSSMLYRDILSTVIITGILAICFYTLQVKPSLINFICLGIGFGVFIGFSKLLKEDLNYLSVFAFLIILCRMVYLKLKEVNKFQIEFLWISVFTICTISTYLVITHGIKAINDHNYGVYLVEDNNSGDFASLKKRLSLIQSDGNNPDIFIDRNQVQLASSNSKTFEKLMPFFNSDNLWKKISCNFNGVCDQSAGFFQNELRDAFVASGYATSAVDLQKYSRIINDEIDIACLDKRLECKSGIGIPGMPASIEKINRKFIVDSSFKLTKSIFNWEYVGHSNPNTLKSEFKELHNSWRLVPGVIWDYENHPYSESALGLQSFKEFLIWFYQVLNIAIFSLCIFGLKVCIRYIKNTKITFNFFLTFLLFLSISGSMILSNVAGWYSFSGLGNYFLIFSPFVIYFYSLVILAFNEVFGRELKISRI